MTRTAIAQGRRPNSSPTRWRSRSAAWPAAGFLALLAVAPLASARGQVEAKPDTARAAMNLKPPRIGDPLDDAQVNALAELALRNIDREYPNKPALVMIGPESLMAPRQMHPAFFGCYDWHSSVHGHWMLVRLLRLHPHHPLAPASRARLDAHLTPERIAVEATRFAADENRSFERMYGWAWLSAPGDRVAGVEGPEAERWRAALRPLEESLAIRAADYLPRLSHPIRTGVHPDTGFALGQLLDYARATGNPALEELAIERCRRYYAADRRYPFAYEPSGEDFFSSGLNEADAMRRVFDSEEFARWFDGFLPDDGGLDRWLRPAEVSDVTDPKIVHLAGLNLSRAWCLDGIAAALPLNDPRRGKLSALAEEHAAAGFRYVLSGHYEGDHWLATFAVYALTRAGR